MQLALELPSNCETFRALNRQLCRIGLRLLEIVKTCINKHKKGKKYIRIPLCPQYVVYIAVFYVNLMKLLTLGCAELFTRNKLFHMKHRAAHQHQQHTSERSVGGGNSLAGSAVMAVVSASAAYMSEFACVSPYIYVCVCV